MILSIFRWETRTLYYVRSCCCQEGFWEFVGCAVATGIPINQPLSWDYRWVVKAAQLTGTWLRPFFPFSEDPSLTEAGLGWWHVAHGRLWWGQCWKLRSKGYSMCINYPTYIAICSRTFIFLICGFKSAPDFCIFNWKTFRLFPCSMDVFLWHPNWSCRKAATMAPCPSWPWVGNYRLLWKVCRLEMVRGTMDWYLVFITVDSIWSTSIIFYLFIWHLSQHVTQSSRHYLPCFQV